MSQGFYQILGVEGSADGESVSNAYHSRLAELVRRLRAARKQGADVSILEGQERTLREAMSVLSDPVRRQRYDAYQRACLDGIPEDAESLWAMARTSLVDPVAVAAVEVLRTSTSLDVGTPFPSAPKPRKWVARQAAAPPPAARPPAARPAPAPAPAALPAPAARPASGPAAAPAVPAPLPPLPPLPPMSEAPPLLTPEQLVEATMPAAEPALAPASLDDIPAIMTRFGPDGRFIHAVRELRHMSLEELATETRISQRYLHAIESNDFGSLPAGTFVRGYVKEVARALGIPELGLVEGYMGLFSHHRG
jgi:hypothetical protein